VVVVLPLYSRIGVALEDVVGRPNLAGSACDGFGRAASPAPAFGEFLRPRQTPPLTVSRRWTMGLAPWFYRSEEEWNTIAERLKLTPCPHCQSVGTLIRHGSLFGFDDSSPQRKTLRARRIFCSNRGRRPGCGRTVSVWMASKLRRSSLTTGSLWRFLQRVVAGSLAAAMRADPCARSQRSWQRIWQRLELGQSRIRTALHGRSPPPTGPPRVGCRADIAQVLDHLQAAFPNDPITTFQQTTRSFFL
jgi:hypothetical protein